MQKISYRSRRNATEAAGYVLGIGLGLGVCVAESQAQSWASTPELAREAPTEGEPVKLVPPVTAAMEVTDVVAQGSGCPQGSFDVSVFDNSGAKSVLFLYRGFQRTFAADPTATLDCMLKFKLKHARPVALNMQNVRTKVVYSGVNLDATQRYQFGDNEPVTVRRSLEGEALGDLLGDSSRQWTSCATEHELEASVAVAAAGAQTAGSQYAVQSTWFSIAERACPLAADLDEKLAPKILKTSIVGRGCGRAYPPAPPGMLVVDGLLNELPQHRPAEGRCTLLIDLQVPSGYQFRGAHFDWRDGLFHSEVPVHYAATYSYSDAQAQRTEWSFPLPLKTWDGLVQSRHRVDLWSPSCARPGRPVQLKIEIEGSHEARAGALGLAGLELEANFRNRAALDQEAGEPAAEWRRCPPTP